MRIWVAIPKETSSSRNTIISIRKIGLGGTKYHISEILIRLINLINLSANYIVVVFMFSMISMIVVYHVLPTQI